MDSFSYTTVINPRAKRLSFSICPNKGLRVVMPKKLSDKYVRRMLSKHQDWINKHLVDYNLKQRQFNKYQFKDRGVFVLNGELHRIVFSNTIKKIELSNKVIVIGSIKNDLPKTKKKFLNWLKRYAKKELVNKLNYFSNLTSISYNSVSLRGQKSIWGSCNQKNNISLNWKLICMPDYVQDYVILHELVHIKHLNHSKIFWHQLNKYHPKVKTAKQWLNAQGDLIQFVTEQIS